MADRRLRVRLGVFVAVTLLGLAGLVVLFGRAPAIFSTKAQYTVLYPEAPGVAVGTPVRKSGVRIGDVTSLDLDENGQVKVGVAVEKKFLPRTGEDATISRGILNGDTSIDFVPRVDPANPPNTLPRGDAIPPDSEIVGIAPVTARTLIGQASQVLPSAQESLGQIVGTARRLEQAIPRFERAADEFGALARSGREVVPELRQTNVRLQDLLGAADPAQPEQVSVRALLKELVDLLRTVRPAADDIRALLKQNGPELTRTLTSVRQAADSANDLLNPDNRKAASATVKNLQVASEDLTRTVRLVGLLADRADGTLKSLTARLDQSEKTFDNLNRITTPLAANADQITRDVSEAARNLNSAITQASQLLQGAGQLLQGAGGQNGTLGKVLSDPSLYNNLNTAVVEAARVMARLEKIAVDLQVFADKIARKPEVLGAGGVVRPSTGLKETPTAPLPPTPPLPIAPTQTGAAAPPQPPAVAPIAPVPFGPGDGVPAYKPVSADRPPRP